MLPQYITESERIAQLEGNVGRKVSRLLDQLFPNGRFQATFDCLQTRDLADQALYILRMELAAENAAARNEGVKFDIAVQGTGVPGQVRVVVTPARFPEALTDKRELLFAFADVMRCFVAFHVMTDRALLDAQRREMLDELAFEPGHVQYTYLAELAAGDYTHIDVVGGNFVTLATALNPQVYDKFMDALQRDDLACLDA